MNRIFSGVQPTGNLHLGNYLGAIRNWVKLQDEFECIYCLVDMHAITIWQEPAELTEATRRGAAALIAAGMAIALAALLALAPGFAAGLAGRLAWLAILVAAGLVVYGALAFLAGAVDRADLARLVRRQSA